MEVKSLVYHLVLNFKLEPNAQTQIPLKLKKNAGGVMTERGIHLQMKVRPIMWMESVINRAEVFSNTSPINNGIWLSIIWLWYWVVIQIDPKQTKKEQMSLYILLGVTITSTHALSTLFRMCSAPGRRPDIVAQRQDDTACSPPARSTTWSSRPWRRQR